RIEACGCRRCKSGRISLPGCGTTTGKLRQSLFFCPIQRCFPTFFVWTTTPIDGSCQTAHKLWGLWREMTIPHFVIEYLNAVSVSALAGRFHKGLEVLFNMPVIDVVNKENP